MRAASVRLLLGVLALVVGAGVLVKMLTVSDPSALTLVLAAVGAILALAGIAALIRLTRSSARQWWTARRRVDRHRA